MVAWSTTAKAGTTLSGSNLIATNTQAGYPGGGGLADTGITAGQKKTWQIIANGAGGLSGVGIASNFPYGTDYLGVNNQGIGYFGDSNVYTNNAGVATWATFGDGDTVQFAYDRTNNRLWARVNGGNWNNSGTANPATNTGGFNVAAITGTNVYPAYYSEVGGAAVILGATAAAQGTIPSGFTAYDPGSGTSVALTGVSSTGAVGSFSSARTLALTGVAAACAVGSMTPVTGVSVALTGVSATASVGSFGKAIARAITGVSATGGVGTLADGRSIGLTGNQATGQVGSVAPRFSVPLTGVSASGQVGSLSPASGVTILLTGVSAAGQVGSLSLSFSIGLSGNGAYGQAGDLSAPAPPPEPEPYDTPTPVARIYKSNFPSRAFSARGRSRSSRA